MALAHFRMLIHEFLNKDLYIVQEEAPLIISDRQSAVCMDKNGKDTKHTRHISRRVHFLSNGENCKIHRIDRCEGGLQLTESATKNVGENYLNSGIKYIMVRLDN